LPAKKSAALNEKPRSRQSELTKAPEGIWEKGIFEVGLDAKIVEFEGAAQGYSESHATPGTEDLLRLSIRPISYRFISGVIRALELCAVGLPGLLAYTVLIYPESSVGSVRYYSTIAIMVLFSAAMFQFLDVYSRESIFARRLRVERVFMAWVTACCALIVLAFGLKISENYSRLWVGVWFISTTGLLVLGRVIIEQWVRKWSAVGRFADRTIIVGAGKQGLRLAEHLRLRGDYQTRIVGFVDDRKTRLPKSADEQRIIGNCDELIRFIREGLVDQVFIALPWSAEERVKFLVHALATTPVRIHLAPDLAGFEFPDRSYDNISGVSMLRLFDRPISGWSHVIKTVEDRVIGTLLAVFLSPLVALIAVAVKIDSRGPVLFKQQRLGFNNRPIEVWKFRTMYTDMTDANCEVQTTKDDPRVTRAGALLRQTSLDELPQFINVMLGHMSIVDPRPHARGTKAEGQLFEHVVDRYAARHKVKPGITGWAQVNGWRGETDTIEKIQRRVEYDLYYIDNWSLWLDIKIMARTVRLCFAMIRHTEQVSSKNH
jgi:polysaccharide biosynthesis protein PslA